MRSEFRYALATGIAAALSVIIIFPAPPSLMAQATNAQAADKPQATMTIAESLDQRRTGYVLVPKENTTRGRAPFGTKPNPSPTPDRFSDVLVSAIYALDRYWGAALPGAFKRPYKSPAKFYQYFPSKGEQGLPCGGERPGAGNAIYCPPTDTIQWDGEFLYRIYTKTGDFAAVLVLAHEWGHAVQQRLGLLDRPSYTIEKELQADCLAGAWTRYADAVLKVIEPGDLDEAMQALLDFKDQVNTPWFDPGAHGTGQQRIRNFNIGYDEAKGPRACVL